MLFVLILAIGVTIWLIREVRKEQKFVSGILHGGSPADVQLLGNLPRELPWQFAFSIGIFVTLVVAVVGLVFVLRAYTRSEMSLRDTRLLAWDIFSSLNEGVITTTREGLISIVNARCEHLLGIDESSVGLPLTAAWPDGVDLNSAVQRVLASGQSQDDLDFQREADGHALRLRAECQLLRDIHGMPSGTILLVRDTTERLLIEERMQRMERFMGLGTLAAGLHHEIKNPLSALSLHVQLLDESLAGEAKAEVSEHLSVLKTEVARMAGVLESFRNYASFNQVNRAQTDVRHLVERTADLVRPSAQKQGVKIKLEIPATGLPTLPADAARLEQVLLNLVMNALEELREGGELVISAEPAENHIVLSVSDNGRGIPENLRARIFNPYFTTKSTGSGMGLAFCDKIIQQHGGHIDVESSSAGTAFHVFLPLDEC